MASFRLQIKRIPQFDKLSFPVQEMVRFGQIGNAEIQNRQLRGVNANDQPAKKLSKWGAIKKARRGRPQIRDMRLSGDFWRNLQVRTASENRVSTSPSTRRNRQLLLVNEQIDTFYAYSPNNQRVLVQRMTDKFIQRVPTLWKDVTVLTT